MLKSILSIGVSVMILMCSLQANADTTYEGPIDIFKTSGCDSIVAALDYHVANHPYSHYKDIYKSFMQDYFGPGHILIDPEVSRKYLMEELSEEDAFLGPVYEPTGYEGNFVRVNLSLIKDGIVPLDVFFDAFVRSAKEVVPPSHQIWLSKWEMIDSCITENNYNFKGLPAERDELIEQLERNEFVVHHSEEYNNSSHFHYRLISRRLFDTVILPLIR